MRPVNAPYSEIAGYRLTRHIGSGGMGDVYKAVHTTLQREAAVKVLFQKDMAHRFENEAYIQSTVSHPNIARLYEYVNNKDVHCIVMEFVEGESLDSLIRRKGKLTGVESEKILAQIVNALEYLHRLDIIHRDIKPQNFKVMPDGTVKMLDFGIAKHKYSPKFTQQGFVVGTTEYMAPEQFQSQVQKKSDIWSLGVLVYEMVTGYLPFEATNQISLRALIAKANFTDPKILVPDIPRRLETIIDKCLRVNPSGRASAQEILTLLKGKTHITPAPKGAPVVIPFLKRWKQAIAAIAGVTFIIIITIILTRQRAVKPEPPNNGGGTIPVSENYKLVINVQGADDAEIILPNGERKPLPYETQGKNGEVIEAIIRANGFLDTLIKPVVSHRRSVYTYELQKIKY